MGNSDNSPMVNIVSTTIAGATWHDVMVAALAGKSPREWPKPGLTQATVCVPSGIVYRQGMNCPRATGTFAVDALAKQDDHWWGGQKIDESNAGFLTSIPPDVTGYRRQLAQEYLRGGAPSRPAPHPTAVPIPPRAPVIVPTAAAIPRLPGNNGNRNRRR